jgi:hypothetical protein
MMKVLRAIALGPVWPLVWWQVGFSLTKDCTQNDCHVCNDYDGPSCCDRAMALVRWYRGE